MQAALETTFLSVDEYLSGEEISDVRHEYIAGFVHAMAGTSDAHNTIAGNLFAALHNHLRGGRCRVFMSDVKVRLVRAGKHIFYYPDVMVTSDPRDTHAYFKEFPKVLIEVLSEATERTDRREKFWNYSQIETLEEYVIASQDRVEVTVFRRSDDWKPEIFRAADAKLRLNSLNFSTQLRAIYEGVKV
jgi:Uma2 family endonuclease